MFRTILKQIFGGSTAQPPDAHSQTKFDQRRAVASWVNERAPEKKRSGLTSTTVQAQPSNARVAGELTWVGPKAQIQLKHLGLSFNDPLAYFWTHSSAGNPEPAAVDLRLPVAAAATPLSDQGLEYWPRYDQITPEQRRIYLNWLASSRRSIPPEVGYAFLFIYGLERRALIEKKDQAAIFDEVVRLRTMYATSDAPLNRSFDSYTSSFLWFQLLSQPIAYDDKRFLPFVKSIGTWNEDAIASALGWLSATGRSLPDWFAFILAEQLPKSLRSVVVRRVRKQLRELFLKRFSQQFPGGFGLKVSKRDRKINYRPASAALPTMDATAPNPMGISSQFNALSELWNECISDLKKLSSVVGKESVPNPTVESWKAMPLEIRQQVDHPLVDSFSQFLAAHSSEAPFTIVSARDVAVLVGIDVQSKLTTASSKKVASIVNDVGYCVEPDATLTGRSYDDDERVSLFLNLSDHPADPQRYNASALMLGVGVTMAAADGKTDADELAKLGREIETAFELNDHEQRRLDALRSLLREQPPELAKLVRPLKKLAKPQREQVTRFALAVVAADGVVTRGELKALQKLYGAVGLDKNAVNADLRSLMPESAPHSSEEPVTVVRAAPGAAGEAIPPIPSANGVGKPAGLTLNREAIAAILRDTTEVSKMLAEAMNVEASEEAVEPVLSQDANPITVDPTLPARYAGFYQVIVTRSDWTRSALSDLAKQHGLMLSGAIEAINDWSTEQHGGPLVYEDDQQFTLEAAYLQ